MENKEKIAHYIAALAQRAILYEVSTTPKPGLVDRNNSGAHKDMDFFTFMASSSSIYKGMYQCALKGLSFNNGDKTKLLDEIRGIGIQCEKDMFKATKGVNTHKGIIFSIGILCAVAGHIYKNCNNLHPTAEELCSEVKEVAKDLVAKDFKNLHNKQSLTNGELLFKIYGFKGIRGEVESGFATVKKTSLHILRSWSKNKSIPMNHIFIEMLMKIIVEGEDTNIITRGGVESLNYAKKLSKDFLNSGGVNQNNFMAQLQELDKKFIEKNISPGGSADLLAVSIFIGLLEGLI